MISAPVSYTFTTEQSSAIAALQIDNDQVQIAYHSNPDKVYTFTVTDSFMETLESSLNDVENVSLGSLIAAGRRTGDLQDVTV